MNTATPNHTAQYVTFRLDHNLFGMNILDTREIVPCMKITKVQQAPAFVLGLINLRGQILTVLDIGILLGLEQRSIHPESHIIVFKHKDVGFIIDHVGDVVGTDVQCIEATPANIDTGVQKYMDCILNLPDEILMVLNAQKILSYTQPHNEMLKESQ